MSVWKLLLQDCCRKSNVATINLFTLLFEWLSFELTSLGPFVGGFFCLIKWLWMYLLNRHNTVRREVFVNRVNNFSLLSLDFMLVSSKFRGLSNYNQSAKGMTSWADLEGVRTPPLEICQRWGLVLVLFGYERGTNGCFYLIIFFYL